MEISTDVILKPYTWWRIGGAADHFALPKDLNDLRAALDFARARELPLTILGGGTNVLVSDEGVAGLVICLKQFRGLEVTETPERLDLVTWAGTPKSELTKEFLRRRLAPALFLCGLPGDVGGGVVMNAGVAEHIVPREFGELVTWVETLDPKTGELRRFAHDDLDWTYRHTAGFGADVVVRVGLSWALDADPELPTKVKLATRNRLQRQPLELPSCGSTFKNPPGHKAGALIEAAGLKGYRLGGAQVSPKHANFIVNLGEATAVDVRGVIAHVRTEVFARAGVTLETEVKFIGR